MTLEEVLGGILAAEADPEAAARAVARAALSPPGEASRILTDAEIDARMVDAVIGRVEPDPGTVGSLVAAALAWARGRRSLPEAPSWDLVGSRCDRATAASTAHRPPAGDRRDAGLARYRGTPPAPIPGRRGSCWCPWRGPRPAK
jgi:hypothetical protein